MSVRIVTISSLVKLPHCFVSFSKRFPDSALINFKQLATISIEAKPCLLAISMTIATFHLTTTIKNEGLSNELDPAETL